MSPKLSQIMLIDDDAINNFIVINNIKKLNITEDIICALNGKEAIEVLSQNIASGQPLPDLILLDINMPIMDGWAFIEEFRKLEATEKPKTNIFMVSSSVYQEDILKAKEFPEIIEFISKPLKADCIKVIYEKVMLRKA